MTEGVAHKGSIQSVNAKVHLSFKRAIAFLFFFEFPNSFLSTPYVSLTKPLVVITNPLCYCTNTPLCRQEIIDPFFSSPIYFPKQQTINYIRHL